MTTRRKPSLLTPIIALVLILLVASGGYMGAYYVNIDRWVVDMSSEPREVVARFRFGNDSDVVRAFFGPAAWLDLRIRVAMMSESKL